MKARPRDDRKGLTLDKGIGGHRRARYLSLPAILPTQLTEEPGRLALTHGAGSGKALRVAGETLPTEPGPAGKRQTMNRKFTQKLYVTNLIPHTFFPGECARFQLQSFLEGMLSILIPYHPCPCVSGVPFNIFMYTLIHHPHNYTVDLLCKCHIVIAPSCQQRCCRSWR